MQIALWAFRMMIFILRFIFFFSIIDNKFPHLTFPSSSHHRLAFIQLVNIEKKHVNQHTFYEYKKLDSFPKFIHKLKLV